MFRYVTLRYVTDPLGELPPSAMPRAPGVTSIVTGSSPGAGTTPYARSSPARPGRRVLPRVCILGCVYLFSRKRAPSYTHTRTQGPPTDQQPVVVSDDDEPSLAPSHKLRRDWKSWMRWKLAASLTERGTVDRAAPVITQRAAGGQHTRCSSRPARQCTVSNTAAYVRSSQQPSESLIWQPPGGQRASPLGLVSRTAAPPAALRRAAPSWQVRRDPRRNGRFDVDYVTLRKKR